MDITNLNNEVLKCIENFTLIDIKNDKVSFFKFNEKITETQTDTYESFYEKLKKIIHPDYLNKYFEAIGINYLSKLDNKLNTINYVKLSSSLSYENYFDVIKLLDDNYVLIITFKSNKSDILLGDDNAFSYEIANSIINIESVISNIKNPSNEVISAVKYINSVLDDIKNRNKDVLNYYKEKIRNEVNQTYKSLLIIDDDNLTRNIFKKVFEKNFNIIEAKNGEEAVEIIEKNVIANSNSTTENIVGIFLDLKMPVMDGFGVLNYLKEKNVLSRMPVIIISADDAKDTKTKVYNYDIADMVEKPFNYDLIQKRVNNMINLYAKSNILNNMVRSQNSEIKNIIKEYVNSYLIDYKELNNDIEKVGNILLSKYASISEENIDIKTILSASKYYDIALKNVPRKYLENINTLSKEEKEKLYNYPINSENILKYYLENESESYIRYAVNIALMHNERYDGLGFPRKIKEDAIPMYIYLINIAIELSSNIKINGQASFDNIIKNIESKSSFKYSPESVKILIDNIEEVKKLWQ